MPRFVCVPEVIDVLLAGGSPALVCVLAFFGTNLKPCVWLCSRDACIATAVLEGLR